MIERFAGFSAKNEAETMIDVVEVEIHHCGLMARRTRKVHLDIQASGGVSTHSELIWVFVGTNDDRRRRCMKWTPVLGPDVKVWRVLLFPNGWSGK